MKITREIFNSFLACPYKTYLMIKNESGEKSEYELVSQEIKQKYEAKILKRFPIKWVSAQEICKIGTGIYQTNVDQNDLSCGCLWIERVGGKSALGVFHCIPVIMIPNEKISREDKLAITYDGFVLGSLQRRMPEYGKIIHGCDFKTARIKIRALIERVKVIISKIRKLESDLPKMSLNRHCQICEFKKGCLAKGRDKDDLSLLSGMGRKEIEAQNKKGIFTVTQYSYTFRARKRFKKSYSFNLKALAIRENKIHIYGTADVPTADVQIYLDVEGDPERDFYYLIGVVVIERGVESNFSFWADDIEGEGVIFNEFVDRIKGYSEFRLYHYGSYEIKFLRKVRATVDFERSKIVEEILNNSVNILSVVYSHVFFPVYSNGLKDVAGYLGFKWAHENASGLQGLTWRRQFELSRDDNIKDKLLLYNMNDCQALKTVTNFIRNIGQNKEIENQFVLVEDLKSESTYKWGKVDFALEDLEYVNNRAYFDYQREKVFVRTHKKLKGIRRGGRFQEKRCYKVNKKIVSQIHRECPCCGGKLYRNGQDYARKVYDLKISDSGIKRWVTSYQATTGRCFSCRKVITFRNFENVSKYGHGLISWALYQNIAGQQPFYRIQPMLDDNFGLSVSGTTLQRFKSIAAEYYQGTYQEIISMIKKGDLVHADETQVSFPGVDGYVWVFTNMEEVYFLYSANREGKFLKELLNGFKGVLVSDFYGAYSSSEWIQQKCLIHLIRDLNDDLRKNPFDKEYSEMTTSFSSLLRQIVATIDTQGLRKRYLRKHKPEVGRFFRNISRQVYQSEIAKQYQKRFQKNEDTLFTFLNYDGIPWNNNNAEHAIKHFAAYRRTMKAGGNFTEKGLKEYLVLLSIYQTCQYKGINFLKFLASGEKRFTAS